MAYCLPTCPKFCCKFKFLLSSTCQHHCQKICQSSCPAHCHASQHVSTMEQSQSTQELCPTICSSNCLLSCPFFVVRCLCQSQAHVQTVALWAAFRHANNIVVKSTILLIFRHSHLLSVHRNLQFTVTTNAQCTVVLPHLNKRHFSQLLTPTGNVQPNFLLVVLFTQLAPVLLHGHPRYKQV